MAMQVYRDSNFVTQMTQVIGKYLYEGKYTVDTLEAFCGITADIISQYIPLEKFMEIADKPMRLPTISIAVTASGQNSVLLS